MGNGQVTVRNLEIVDIDTEDNVLMVKGAVPGPNGGYVLVRGQVEERLSHAERRCYRSAK